MLNIERDGEVWVIAMRAGENRFNPDSLAALNAALDEVEAFEGPAAVVLTGEGKFFSNGLDLEWMGQAPEGGAVEVAEGTMRLMARVLTFPTAVVAAINGHAFAAGAMLALACDSRVMREDRGYFCLPEADINIPFTPGMSALIQGRLTPQTAHEAMVTARRYTAAEALEAGIVQATRTEAEVLPAAIEMARPLAGKQRHVVGAIKQGAYGAIVEKLHLPLIPDTQS